MINECKKCTQGCSGTVALILARNDGVRSAINYYFLMRSTNMRSHSSAIVSPIIMIFYHKWQPVMHEVSRLSSTFIYIYTTFAVDWTQNKTVQSMLFSREFIFSQHYFTIFNWVFITTEIKSVSEWSFRCIAHAFIVSHETIPFSFGKFKWIAQNNSLHSMIFAQYFNDSGLDVSFLLLFHPLHFYIIPQGLFECACMCVYLRQIGIYRW